MWTRNYCTIGQPRMSRSNLRRLGLTVVCGLVGLGLDLWRQGSSAPLLLGRIVTLPIAILYGPWWGALAALIHSLAGRGLFAVGMRILPIEAIVIGWFARRGRSPILGGLIVWMAVTALAGRGPQPLRRRLPARHDPSRRAAARRQRIDGGRRRRSDRDRRRRAQAGRARCAPGAASARRRVSRVRSRRDGSRARARVGRRTAVVGEAGSGRRRPPPRSGGRAQPAHRRLRRGSRARGQVARRRAHQPAGRRCAAAAAAGAVSRRLSGVPDDLRRRPARRRPRDLPGARFRVAADQRPRIFHQRGADQAGGDLRRHPRPVVVRADHHDRRADLRRRRRASPASPADRSISRNSISSSATSRSCRTRASPCSISTRA